MSDGTLYKVLDAKRRAIHGGWGCYPDVGEWTEHLDRGRLVPCVYGYHLVYLSDLSRWLGPTIYEAEPCPDHEPVDRDGKVVTCSVRLTRQTAWDETSARFFAADCAEMALLGERECGREPDERAWDAVRVARAFARGEATDSQRSAAWEAARDVAWAAMWDAAGDAARAVVHAAADARVWDAARTAAGAAARAAVGAAARAAAGDADATVARDAAEAAAEAAARAAARGAAGDAAYRRFGERLAAYLDGRHPGPIAPLYGAEDGGQDE